jgi:enolase
MNATIQTIHAREILDSRGNPTVEVDVDHDGDGQITYYEYLGAIAHIGFQ